MWEYKQPVKIIFGNGEIHRFREIIQSLGYHRGVLVCDSFLAQNGFAARMVEESQGLLRAVYDGTRPNPTVDNVDQCAALLRQEQADFVVALGGGSSMDCAKSAASVAVTGDSITKYHATGVALPPEHLPLVAIPTTAGTGAEVTCSSVLTNVEKGFKAPIISDNFYPVLAIVDPELTYTVPRRVAVGTGLDVLSHAVEGFLSVNHQPVCDALALHAARLVMTHLEAACGEEIDPVAKEKMAEASVIAGMAFSIPKTGASHACSFILTNRYGIPHGEACGLTLDYFIRVNAEAEGGRLHQFAKQLGYRDCYDFCDAIAALKQRLGARVDLKDKNLTQEDLEQLITGSRHPNMDNSPTKITDEMLREMYQSFL